MQYIIIFMISIAATSIKVIIIMKTLNIHSDYKTLGTQIVVDIITALVKILCTVENAVFDP